MLGYFTKRQTAGLIAYYGLRDWWLSTFTDEEREYIIATYQPLGSSGDTLTSGEITFTTQSTLGFLSTLAGWFYQEQDRPIARRILAKAEQVAKADLPLLDRHFFYQAMIEFFYRDRDEPGCLDRAIDACRQQISLAPLTAQAFKAEYGQDGDPSLPAHKGYHQLAIILEKQSRFQEAIDLCSQAARLGWGGDWAGRIERCKKKMMKLRPPILGG